MYKQDHHSDIDPVRDSGFLYDVEEYRYYTSIALDGGDRDTHPHVSWIRGALVIGWDYAYAAIGRIVCRFRGHSIVYWEGATSHRLCGYCGRCDQYWSNVGPHSLDGLATAIDALPDDDIQ